MANSNNSKGLTETPKTSAKSANTEIATAPAEVNQPNLNTEEQEDAKIDEAISKLEKSSESAGIIQTSGYASFRSTTDGKLIFLQLDSTLEAATKTLEAQPDDGTTEEFLFVVPVSYSIDRLG